MKLVVTGGAGFIGSAVIRLAISRGYSVVNVDCLTYAGRLENLGEISSHDNYVFEHVDIANSDKINQVLLDHKPDFVMHLAAESHVDRSIDRPFDFMRTNVVGTFHLLEAARKYWISAERPDNFRLHHVSTDEVFGSLQYNSPAKFSEESSYDPRSPYAASKASSDHLVRSWFETYGLPILITNCSNNYGPYQFPEKLIPLMIKNALAELELPIYGSGSNIRDWLYVDDHADALLLVLEKGKIGRSYNIGSENEISNLELVHEICNILDSLKPRKIGSYSELIRFVADRPGHDARYAIDPNRLRTELNWKPSVTFKQGLQKTVQWYLDNEDWWKRLNA